MAIMLFTDFGANDLYVGQVKAVLDRYAPGVRVIDLLHEAPVFDPRASAHLLAALARQIPRGTVVLGVVDPGVGGARDAVVLRADGRWYVGPDNGLFSVVAGRASTRTLWCLTAAPPGASVSFHGRDVFAPLAAAVATDDFPNESVEQATRLQVMLPHGDLAEVIYVDHYGNAFTGLRAEQVPHSARLAVGGRIVDHARVFADAPRDAAFWYENSLGLVEVAVCGASAAQRLGIGPGTRVAWASAMQAPR
jgi:S-adenosylmethionine hydrolase